MDARTLPIFFLLLTSLVINAWQSVDEYSDRGRRGLHYHSKRHMLVRDSERRRRVTTQKPKELRKKPTGNLKPIEEDDMEDVAMVSVAIGPPTRPKYDKLKQIPKSNRSSSHINNTAVNLIKDVLALLGKEFLTHPLNEDVVFGQYIGVSIRNFTRELKLKIQHEILDLIVKYQKMSLGETSTTSTVSPRDLVDKPASPSKEINIDRKVVNETDEGWPDFKNLATIVG